MTQRALPIDGHCSGPLFAPPVKRRPPRRRPGTLDHGRIRRAAEKRAVPIWADRKAMRALKNEVKRRNAQQLTVWSIEHLVPLQHPYVCGLHWEGNMEIVDLRSNMKKCNFHWPDMWEPQQELFDGVA
jgi:hypothetical protein